MKHVKLLWAALPIAVLFATWAVGYHYITPHPFATWYGFPLLFTLATAFVVSLYYAISKLSR